MLQKIEHALTLPIVGLYEFSDDDIKTIRNKIVDELKERDLRKPSITTSKYLLVWLFTQAKNWGEASEGKFWDRMVELLTENEHLDILPADISIYAYDQYDSILSKYNKMIFRSKQNKRMFRELILFHALAPKVSLEALIKLLLKLYLDEDLFNKQIADDEPLFENIQKWLTYVFSLNDDAELNQDMQFEGNTYQIRAAFKYGFRQAPSIMTDLIKTIIGNIDHLQYCEPLTQSDVIADSCKKVFAQYGVSSIKKHRRTANNVLRVSDFNKINATYILDDSMILSISLPDIYCSDMDIVECNMDIYAGTEFIAREPMRFIGQGPKRKIRHKIIQISDFWQYFNEEFNISFIIKTERKVLFDSKEMLYRKFMLFNEVTETRKSINPINQSYYIALPKNALKELIPYSVTTKSQHVFAFFASEPNSIQYGAKVIFFGSRNKIVHIIEMAQAESKIQYIENEIECLFYKKLTQFTLQFTDPNLADNLFLIHNECNCGRASLVTAKVENGNYVLNEHAFFEHNQVHTIRLVNSYTKVLFEFSYFITPSLEITFHPTIIYEKQHCCIYLDRGGNYLLIDPLNVVASYAFASGYIQLVQPTLLWGIDEEPLHNSRLHGLVWGKGLRNNTQLRVQSGIEGTLNVRINNTTTLLGKRTGDYGWVFPISDGIADFHSKNIANQVDISFEIGNFILPAFSAVYSELFQDDPLILYDSIAHTLTFDAHSCFVGDENALFDISLVNDEFQTTFQTSIHQIHQFEILDGWYDITIAINTSTPFVENPSRKIYFKQDVLLGNLDVSRFNGQEIVLGKSKIQGKRQNIKGIINQIKYIDTNAERPLYHGKIRISGYNSYVEFEVEKDWLHGLSVIMPGGEKVPVVFDAVSASLCTAICDGKRYFEIRSINFIEQEV